MGLPLVGFCRMSPIREVYGISCQNSLDGKGG